MGTFREQQRSPDDHKSVEIKERLAKSSFTLGRDNVDYQSSNMEQMKWKQPRVHFED